MHLLVSATQFVFLFLLVLTACDRDRAEPTSQATAVGEIAWYTCPMHPSVKSETPGACPICGMDLTPVTRQSLASGVVIVDPVRRQKLGVTTASVERRPMRVPIHAVGTVTYDQGTLANVTVRAQGWVEEVYVDEVGRRVVRGERLFSLTSPELYAAQEELLQVRRSKWADEGMERAARQRLRLWGLTEAQVDEVVAQGESRHAVDILSPASGFVLEKDVVAGDQVMPGHKLYLIASLDRVWVEAEVYEADLPRVYAGQAVTVRLPYAPDRTFEGKVSRVVPFLTGATRTARVRVELPNEDLALKPNMFAQIELHGDAEERLVVLREAVIYTGTRRLVFVDQGEGRLQPREVRLGLRGEHEVEILSGLTAGEVVVTSGNFLIAAESRLRSATEFWGGTDATP